MSWPAVKYAVRTVPEQMLEVLQCYDPEWVALPQDLIRVKYYFYKTSVSGLRRRVMGASLLFQNRSSTQIMAELPGEVKKLFCKGTKANYREGTRKVLLREAPGLLVLEGYIVSPMVKSALKVGP